MSGFIRNLKIRNKLMLLLVLPLVGLFYFVYVGVGQKVGLAREMTQVKNLSALATTINQPIQKLQIERGASSVFVGSRGRKMRSELLARRINTDQSFDAVRTFLESFDPGRVDPKLKDLLDRAMVNINRHNDKRDEISGMVISVDDSFDYYTRLIASMMNINNYILAILGEGTDAKITRLISAYISFSHGKERAGRERALMAGVFAENKLSLETQIHFHSLVAEQNSYKSTFLSFATPGQIKFYAQHMQGRFIEEVESMRSVAFQKGVDTKLDVDPQHWFNMITGKIDLLKEVEDKIAVDIVSYAGGVQKEAELKAVGFIIIIVAVFIVLLVVGFFLVNFITKPLHAVSSAIKSFAGEDLRHKEIEVTSTDEVGELAASFNKMSGDLETSRDQLVEAKDYTDNIIKSIHDTLIVIGPDLMIRTANRALCGLLRYKEDELVGKPFETIIEEGNIFAGTGVESLMEACAIKNHELIYKTKTGENIPVSFSCSGLRGKNGDLVGIIGIARDVRELKEMQEKLVRNEKLAALGKLSGAVGHELRNPLGAISNSVYYLRMKLGEKLEDEKVEKHLTILEEEVRAADKVITDILTFGRIKGVQLAKADIMDVIKVSLARVKIPDNIQLTIEPEKDLPQIPVDASQLKLVFSNLILNAVQAMNKGGELTISAVKKDDYMEVGFLDTGVGIPKENLSKVFEPLFSTKTHGTGLGLQVCYSIVDIHDGTIEVESEEGTGTKFIVRLPIEKRKEGDPKWERRHAF